MLFVIFSKLYFAKTFSRIFLKRKRETPGLANPNIKISKTLKKKLKKKMFTFGKSLKMFALTIINVLEVNHNNDTY